MVKIAMLSGQAAGAIPNGCKVVKQNSEEGDAHPDGTRGVVLSSIGAPPEMLAEGFDPFFYFVDWGDSGIPIGTMGRKVRKHMDYSGVIIDGAIPRSARERAETLFERLIEISQVGPHADLDPARQVDLGPDAAEWSEIEDEIIDKIAAALPAKYELTLGEGCPGDVVIVNTEEEA